MGGDVREEGEMARAKASLVLRGLHHMAKRSIVIPKQEKPLLAVEKEILTSKGLCYFSASPTNKNVLLWISGSWDSRFQSTVEIDTKLFIYLSSLLFYLSNYLSSLYQSEEL